MNPSGAVPGSLAAESGTRRWGLAQVFGWFVVAQVGTGLWAALVFGPLAGPLGAGRLEDLTVKGMFLSAFALWAAYGLGPLVTTTRQGRGPVADLGTKIKLRDVPIGLALGAFVQWPVLSAVYFPILRFVDGDPSGAATELGDRVDGPLDVVLLVLLAGVMAPLVEEIFYRGFLLRGLLRSLSPWIAVVVQALIFAAVHLQALQFPGLFVFGLLSGALAVRTGRLGMSWALHAGFNGLTLLLLLT